MKSRKIVGNILCVGDLHISDTFRGRHKDYLTGCLNMLKKLDDMVTKENIKTLILTGDLIGVSDHNIKNKEVFAIVCMWFKRFIDRGVRVISIRGNHDFSAYPDFSFLEGLEYFETSQSLGGYIDYYGAEENTIPEIRFHLVDFGQESRELDIAEGDVTNIAITHNNFTIQGLTNWYQKHDGIDLGNHKNFAGVYMVINGHIHEPSPEMYGVDAVWGERINLFVLGSPTRPSTVDYTSCWAMKFYYDNAKHESGFSAIPIELPPLEDTYFSEDTILTEDNAEEALLEAQRVADLSAILGDVMKFNIAGTNLEEQIRSIPNASEQAKSLAVRALHQAMMG